MTTTFAEGNLGGKQVKAKHFNSTTKFNDPLAKDVRYKLAS